jgi:hypothetical protein
MKSVTFSEVLPAGPAGPVRSGVTWFALTLALGLPALMFAFHQLDPGAPLPFIVLPVLAGGVAPMLALRPGRFEVSTRFEAQHLVRSLETTLGELGFERVGQRAGTVHYRTQGARWLEKEIAVTVRAHSIEVSGPVPALRALQAQLAC